MHNTLERMKRFYYITLLLVLLFVPEMRAFNFDPSEVKNAYNFKEVNAGFVQVRTNTVWQSVQSNKKTSEPKYSVSTLFASSAVKKRSTSTSVTGVYQPVYQTGTVSVRTRSTFSDFHNLAVKVDPIVPRIGADNLAYGLETDEDDEPIGFKTPVGDVVLPLLIMIALYGAVMVRRYNKKHARRSYRRR